MFMLLNWLEFCIRGLKGAPLVLRNMSEVRASALICNDLSKLEKPETFPSRAALTTRLVLGPANLEKRRLPFCWGALSEEMAVTLSARAYIVRF